ncbi:MAG: glycosyl transferase [Ruminococcaceae bacterium]|nr:glycosyl transferase [Oscillospiraceae bacterium]
MKWLRRLLFLILLILLGVVGVLTYQGYQQYEEALQYLPLDEAAEDIRTQEHFTPLEMIPEFYCEAVVAIEDRRFYDHEGFDVIGITRALIRDIKAKKLLEGGSTLTQQLAKNIYFPQDDTPQRKIAELFMARAIEEKYSKQEILELYVNGIYYGSGYYTIYDASVGYFGKEPMEMNEYECTLLAGIPNAPSVYSLDVNPDLAEQRQEQVVAAMVDCGYLLQMQAEDILNSGE